jgi:hypothetical protein
MAGITKAVATFVLTVMHEYTVIIFSLINTIKLFAAF